MIIATIIVIIITTIVNIYLLHPFLQWLFVLQTKKKLKMNNNVKIYHITLNTKNIKLTNQTQIEKEE